MHLAKIRGYFLVVFSGLLLFALVVLATLQWGNRAAVSLYGKNMDVRTLHVVLFSVIGTLITIVLLWMFIRGAMLLRRERRLAPKPPPPQTI